MPGLVGLITGKPRGWAESQLSLMLNALVHESFYVSGTWTDEKLGVYVGWVARMGSFGDGMPLHNERADKTLRLRAARREAAAAPYWELSQRELEVLRLLPSGLSQREIAAELYVSFNTVKTHTRAIFRKLGAASRAEAVARARELGLL